MENKGYESLKTRKTITALFKDRGVTDRKILDLVRIRLMPGDINPPIGKFRKI
jgi:hypothetical protein